MLNGFLHTPKLKHSFFKKLRNFKNPTLLEVWPAETLGKDRLPRSSRGQSAVPSRDPLHPPGCWGSSAAPWVLVFSLISPNHTTSQIKTQKTFDLHVPLLLKVIIVPSNHQALIHEYKGQRQEESWEANDTAAHTSNICMPFPSGAHY